MSDFDVGARVECLQSHRRGTVRSNPFAGLLDSASDSVWLVFDEDPLLFTTVKAHQLQRVDDELPRERGAAGVAHMAELLCRLSLPRPATAEAAAAAEDAGAAAAEAEAE
eukprot:COSAG04_NODE_7184_length_1172_cov_1.630941_2_plen_109_part_01